MGQLLFYDPTAIDPRFDDPGGWINCSGTLVGPTIPSTTTPSSSPTTLVSCGSASR